MDETNEEKVLRRKVYTREDFAKIILSDIVTSKMGKSMLKKYSQSDVRDLIENYKQERSQKSLVEISRILYAKSPQYKRLVQYFSGMATFSATIVPIRDIQSMDKSKVEKQYVKVAEILKNMNLRHEMKKVLNTAFVEDVFYGYVHRNRKDFYIQKIDSDMAKITSIEDGIYNYSIDMSRFSKNEKELNQWAEEIQIKYYQWKAMKNKNSKVGNWVELDAKNTICIKINEDVVETFPPFAGVFDSIFDIDGFKRLRKDREEIGNYMIVTQQLPVREDSDNNNDFVLDEDLFQYFHEMALDTVPDNIGVITSPMKLDTLKFDRDRADSDGVAKAERDFWSGSGTSQLLFNADKSTSEGLRSGIKTDEQIVFEVLTQIERWVNRLLKFEFKDLMWNVDILDVTNFNKTEMATMYLEASQNSHPFKTHYAATLGVTPIELLGLAFLENEVFKLHEKFIPLQSTHTQSSNASNKDGRPEKDQKDKSDETVREEDKPNK